MILLPAMTSLLEIGLLLIEGADGEIGALAPWMDTTSLSQSICDNCLTYATNASVPNLSPGRVLKI